MKRFAAFWLPAQAAGRVDRDRFHGAGRGAGLSWLQASRQSVKDPGFRCGRWSGSGIRRRLWLERVASLWFERVASRGVKAG